MSNVRHIATTKSKGVITIQIEGVSPKATDEIWRHVQRSVRDQAQTIDLGADPAAATAGAPA